MEVQLKDTSDFTFENSLRIYGNEGEDVGGEDSSVVEITDRKDSKRKDYRHV